MELAAVQYPGRQDRYHEPLISDMGRLADEIAQAVQEHADRPMAFFGHSLGATVAFEVARRLRPRFPTPVTRLFVSARKTPADCRPSGRDYRRDEEMRAYMRRVGGLAERAVDDEDLWHLTMPPLRNDLLLSEGYRYQAGAPLTCPITAIAAELDRTCPIGDMRRWADHTIGAFDAHVVPGDHYYINEVPPELLELITARTPISSKNIG